MDAGDSICRSVCPWEQEIEGIRPICMHIRIGPEHVCSELSTMRLYGQWTASLNDGTGPLINLITRESVVEYDPVATRNLGVTIPYVQGNLRQVRAARPRWVVLVGRLPGDTPPLMKP